MQLPCSQAFSGFPFLKVTLTTLHHLFLQPSLVPLFPGFALLFFSFNLFERKSYRETNTQRDLPTACLFPKCSQQPEAKNSILVSHMDGGEAVVFGPSSAAFLDTLVGNWMEAEQPGLKLASRYGLLGS